MNNKTKPIDVSNQGLREYARAEWNGAHTVQICRNCFAVATSPTGRLNTAKIVDHCEKCPTPK